MCGIAGIYNLNREPVGEFSLKQMCDIQSHRGPDDEGQWINANIGLGHRRLSIIDLTSTGHQPMANEDGSIWITCNGEIYNYLDLTQELKSVGHIFKSTTDTEVIIHAYEEWEEECINRFNGMFAFAIWDSRKKKLFCARDRFGIKPFYYYFDGKKFLFASEMKAILEDHSIIKEPNNQTIYDYLALGYLDCTEETFFKGIKRLLPAHYMIIKEAGLVIKRYWDLKPSFGPVESTDRECAQKFYELFEDSVRLRLQSDVSVGTCLSGGIDSSSIVCVVNNLLCKNKRLKSHLGLRQKTFSACFDNKAYDEQEFIQAVIEKTGVEANYVFPQGEELFDIISKIIWHQEEPFRSTSIFAQWKVMKLAKEVGITVLLDGQGGDELLAGYHIYYRSFFADLVKSFRTGMLIEELRSYRRLHLYSRNKALIDVIYPFIPHSLKFLIKKLFEINFRCLHSDFLRTYQRSFPGIRKFNGIFQNHLYSVLTFLGLPSLLRYEDKNSMAFSIEARVPFLDYRLVDFMFSLPSHQKIRNGVTKFILREAMKGILPEKVGMRKDKMGFVTPEDIWFRTVAKDTIIEILNSKNFRERGYFNVDRIKKAFEAHCEGRMNINFFIWRWINLELWLRTFFK